jgi:hypothetical protein
VVMALGIEAGGGQRRGQKERKNSPKGMHGGSLTAGNEAAAYHLGDRFVFHLS